MSCELCDGPGGELLWQDGKCRVVRVGDPDYPGFCRVIWQKHEKEMTDLAPVEQRHLMHVVLTVEHVLREMLHPDKVNLASLGNMTPHVHWHVIPRFRNDRHFPNPVWGPAAARDYAVTAVDSGELARSLQKALSMAPYQ